MNLKMDEARWVELFKLSSFYSLEQQDQDISTVELYLHLSQGNTLSCSCVCVKAHLTV